MEKAQVTEAISEALIHVSGLCPPDDLQEKAGWDAAMSVVRRYGESLAEPDPRMILTRALEVWWEEKARTVNIAVVLRSAVQRGRLFRAMASHILQVLDELPDSDPERVQSPGGSDGGPGSPPQEGASVPGLGSRVDEPS